MQDFWNARYREAEYAYGTEPNDFLRDQAKRFKKGSKVLTLAEGEGRNAAFLASLGANVTAIDFSEAGREKAYALADDMGVTLTYLVQNVMDLVVTDNKWDAVIAIFAHVPPPVRGHMFNYIRHALKPGGVIVLEGYTPKQIGRGTGGPPSEEMMFSSEMLKSEFAGFDILKNEEKVRNIREGDHHSGKGAIVQFIARKK
ncbi:MAG: methyltransferase domain-containing protein [Sneathiella sp.]|nr:methyltransferase domain-containing protein [Sneathiella sp.]